MTYRFMKRQQDNDQVYRSAEAVMMIVPRRIPSSLRGSVKFLGSSRRYSYCIVIIHVALLRLCKVSNVFYKVSFVKSALLRQSKKVKCIL
jgi:hypothetical protein